MSSLFGHKRGAFSGDRVDRKGLFREANGGVLFLDEIDELGLDEQAMILHAIESGKFYPLGSDYEITSKFQLIVGANQNLAELVANGKFRADLFARLNLWTFKLPELRQRREDIKPNIEFELARLERQLGVRVGFNVDASKAYQKFAIDPSTLWPGNFRDLSASIQRLCTLAPRGRITLAMVEQEISDLKLQWMNTENNEDKRLIKQYLPEGVAEIDLFDIPQLATVIRICEQSKTLSSAGRSLYSISRATKASHNDADRLRKYLNKFNLSWDCFSN